MKSGVAPPSSRSVHVTVPVPPVSLMPTATVPLTVAPSAGLVNEARSAGWPFCTVTTRAEAPVLPAASRALATTVVDPSLTPRVSHAIEIGPDAVSAVVATVAPPTLSV